MLTQIQKEVASYANPEKASRLQRFFKTGRGEYGEGDKFLGLIVPIQRAIAKKYNNLSISDIALLINSAYHEFRLIGLFILIYQFNKANEEKRKQIFKLYISKIKYINNWDLIDLSAPHIVGAYLLRKNKKLLYNFAKAKNIWKRRIAILSTFAFIRNDDFADAIQIATILLYDTHDLIHKAAGWMLREIGKRNQKQEELFLKKHYRRMPRTMLRYAIERFPEKKRRAYLTGKIKENE